MEGPGDSQTTGRLASELTSPAWLASAAYAPANQPNLAQLSNQPATRDSKLAKQPALQQLSGT